MAQTYSEQLDRVQDAIAAIESGAQSASITTGTFTRSWTKADLAALYKREEWLRSMVARESGGGGINVYGVTPL